ncbi:Uncharacterised protein [Pseudescherichia vulneris]|nr:Uncharacterised protein [Pseudescherichia vulneris]
MLNAHKDQSGFFVARDDLNRVGDDLLRTLEEISGVGGLAQSVGANNADVSRVEALQAFGKQRQAAQAALNRLFAQNAVLIQAVGQMHALLQAANDLHGAIHHTGNDHVETVRTEIDRSKLLRPWGIVIYRHRLVWLFE